MLLDWLAICTCVTKQFFFFLFLSWTEIGGHKLVTCFLKSIRSIIISIYSTPSTRQSFFLLDYFSFKGSNKGSHSLFPFEINLV